MTLANAVSFTAAAPGAGSFTFGTARDSFLTMAQAVTAGTLADGQTVSYSAQNSLTSPTQREWGRGTFASAGSGTIARTTVIGTVDAGVAGSGSALNFSSAPVVSITALSEDFTSSRSTSFRNVMIANGSLELWQRGAGNGASIAVAASTTAYTADRWYITTGANEASTVSVQTGLTNRSQFCGRIQRNSGQTGTAAMTFGYPLTKEECIRLRGENITLQFYASTGANWSPSSGTLNYNVYFGTGTEGKRGGGFTGESNPITGSVNLATSASATQVTASSSATVSTTATQGEVQFTWTPSGTASTNDWFQIDDVQLEPGTTPTDYERPTFAFMLVECQRHYRKTFPYNTAPAQNAGTAGAITVANPAAGSATIGYYWKFDPPMRVAPTVTSYNPSAANANWRQLNSGTDKNASVDFDSTKSADGIYIIEITSALTVADRCLIHLQADSGL